MEISRRLSSVPSLISRLTVSSESSDSRIFTEAGAFINTGFCTAFSIPTVLLRATAAEIVTYDSRYIEPIFFDSISQSSLEF